MKKLAIAALLLIAVVAALNLVNVGPMAARATVASAWVRLSALPDRPAAGYFTIALSGNGETLRTATSPAATRIEMHQTMMRGGGMSHMAPRREVNSDKASRIDFVPGGRHLMIYGLDPALKPGATIPLTLTFAKAPAVTVQATLVGAGDPPPG